MFSIGPMTHPSRSALPPAAAVANGLRRGFRSVPARLDKFNWLPEHGTAILPVARTLSAPSIGTTPVTLTPGMFLRGHRVCKTIDRSLGTIGCSGLRHATCIGGLMMSLVGVSATLSAAPIGALGALGLGVGILLICISVGAVAQCLVLHWRAPRLQHLYRAELLLLRAMLHGSKEAVELALLHDIHRSLGLLDRCAATLTLDLLRGTLLRPLAECTDTWRHSRIPSAN